MVSGLCLWQTCENDFELLDKDCSHVIESVIDLGLEFRSTEGSGLEFFPVVGGEEITS